MTFRKPHAIRPAKQGGFFVDGIWHEGVSGQTFEIMASIQPARQSDYDLMKMGSDGAKVERMVRIYTDTELKQAGNDGSSTAEGDVLLYDDCEFLIRDKSEWQSGVINHYRYLAVKI